MDLKNFSQAIRELAEEKGISAERVVETIEMAIAAAYKKDYGQRGQIVRAKLSPETGDIKFSQVKIVVDETMIKSEEEIAAEEEERARRLAETVEEVSSGKAHTRRSDEDEEETEEGEKKVRFNPEKHIMLDEALKIKPDAAVNDEIAFDLEPHEDFGRIASQTAKQVIIQRIREAEREAVYDEYKDKEMQLVSGIIQRIEGKNVFVDLGRGVGMLPFEEQIPREFYRLGERVKAIIILVEKNQRGSGIFLSRIHPELLQKLFELEVPEIASGAVEIKSIAREAGSRSKVAVASNEDGIDPVGSMVGQRGVRVSTVIQEIGGEKIDIIEWSEKPEKFIANSLSPAKVLDVEINEKRKDARAMVPDDQLSLAIGKGGQNVRLAAKLTGWRIDVRSQKTEGASATPEGEAVIANEEFVETAKEEKEKAHPEVAEELKKALEKDEEVKEEKPESIDKKAGEKKEKKAEKSASVKETKSKSKKNKQINK
ncbi:transcription termination/antitermination protein NusA [Patescibacteria group bacterium]|nr:transcription termination/antitermination protein NusA [Patescibacteria group bacterium]